MKHVSFDFDQTLSTKNVQRYAVKLKREGFNLWICTSRYEEEKLKGLNDDIYNIAEKLEIPKNKIIFTNTKPKYKALLDVERKENIKFLWHLDDDEVEIREITTKTYIPAVYLLSSGWKKVCEIYNRSKFK